jgi:glutamine synthetase type III
MQPEEELTPEESAVEEPTSGSETPAAEEAAIPEEVETEAAEEVEPESTFEREAEIGQPHPKKSFWGKVLPWVIVAIVFYLGGLATIYFALYQPDKQIAAAAVEADAAKIADLTGQYDQALKQYRDAQIELDLTKSELQAAYTTVGDQIVELAQTKQLNIAYKFLVDVSSSRAALEKPDISTARQAINISKADLKELEATELQADSLAGFADRLDEAASNLTEPGLEKSRAALNTLYSSLLLLIDNLP